MYHTNIIWIINRSCYDNTLLQCRLWIIILNTNAMTTDEIKAKLKLHGISVVKESRVNNCGDRLDLSNKAIINLFDTGKYNVQGRNSDTVMDILNSDNQLVMANNKVFVVYGHDHVSRTQLDAMLRRWNLEPLILDQLVSSGATVIEKLEEYTQQVNFGIVLATPDDVGYAKKDGEDYKKSRVRQNVVLEMGMLLSSLGRKRVAILLKEDEDFESPSDIAGLIYIPFKNNVEDAKVSLAKEMEENGYKIEMKNL